MPTLVQLQGLGELEIPDEYNTQQIQDAIALANLQDPAFQAIDQELIGINNLLSEMERGGLTPPKFTPTSQEVAQVSDQDRTYLGEILAGLRSGAQFAVGSGLSGIERIAERVGLDPTGDEEGWVSQAGDALKRGAQEIQASEDKETLFKFSNAFGSILGFAAPAVIAAPLSGGASLGFWRR